VRRSRKPREHDPHDRTPMRLGLVWCRGKRRLREGASPMGDLHGLASSTRINDRRGRNDL